MRLGVVQTMGLWFAALLLPAAAAQQRAPERLLSVGGVQMLNCAPVSNRPCFRVMVEFGKGVRTVPDASLLSNTSIGFDGIHATPFYVSAQDRAAGGRKPRTVMILMDISGSMNMKMSNGVSRFEAAKEAVDRFVSSLDPEMDRVAVVPFDNHGVISTIRAARFVPGGEEARSLLGAIPNPRGDTALYAAISCAIDVLEQRQRTERGSEYQLIVITDGIDDLGRDPDPELRRRPVSIDAVALKTERSSISVYPIGIGGSDDTGILAPLERISLQNSHMVQEPDELIEILAQARPAVATRMQVSFLSPYATAGQLEGRQHTVRVVIRQPGRPVEGSALWAPKESMIAPQAGEECSPGERQALSTLGPPAEDYTVLIRPLATLAVFACILLLCWFLMPRLIWPEKFSEDLPKVDGGQRWSAGRQSPSSKAAPAGGVRQETEPTYVMPRQESDPRSRFK